MTALAEFAQTSLWHFSLVFLRIGAVVLVLPVFGATQVPLRVRLTGALAFTAIVAPAVPLLYQPQSPLGFAIVASAETIIGLALGIGVRLFVWALQTAGTIAAQSTSLSQILGNAGVDPMPAIGQLLTVAGLALATMLGLHVHIARLLILSYDVFAYGQFPLPRSLSAWGVAGTARAFALAFMLAAPFVILSMLYNLALGVINRAMPQLMVAFVGAPVITFGGLALLMLTAPLILAAWGDALIGFFNAPMGSSP